MSGYRRYTSGPALHDIAVWCPKMGYAHLFHTIDGSLTIRGDWIGLFYCPLVLFDQQYIHPTINYFDESSEKEKLEG